MDEKYYQKKGKRESWLVFIFMTMISRGGMNEDSYIGTRGFAYMLKTPHP